MGFGGPPVTAFSITKELVKRGHDVIVYTTNALHSSRNLRVKVRPHVIDGIKVYYFNNILRPDNLFISPGLIINLQREIKSFDVVFVHMWRAFQALVACTYAYHYNVPYLVKPGGSLPRIMDKKKLKRIQDELFGHRILENANKVIAVSELEVEQFNHIGISSNKIVKIPNGIDLSEYEDLPLKGSFKKKYQISKNEKIILYLGRIHKIKGIDLLIKAFAEIQNEIKNIKLVIVGPDDGFLTSIKKLTLKLGIKNKVLFTGPLYGRNKLEAYVDASIYVLPSRYEIWGMTVLEAMACNTPVLLTKNCGLSEFIHNKVGLSCEPNVENLTNSLIKILLSENTLEEYRVNCKKIIKEFDIQNIVEKFESLLLEVSKNYLS